MFSRTRNIAAARAAMALLWLVVSTAGAAGNELDRFFAEVETFEAGFEQAVLDEGLNVIEESAGRMWLLRPGRFRWEYGAPDPQLIVGDGKKVWIHDMELEQITVRDQVTTLGNTPAALLAGKGDVRKRFTVEDLGDGGPIHWYRLLPKTKSGDSSFDDVRIGFEEGRLRLMELLDGLGQTTRIILKDMRENVPADPQRFVFTPPPGVDIIDEQKTDAAG
ncbi:MAG: outer membrane lipoprotein chaperone LolA [Gammaproteobacteria bacterium]|nr:outer membrane lipoprotein chaperone LolA [Gammaproteobacteria bacterium]